MVEPFGNLNETPNPLDLGQQYFLGLTVVRFTSNSTWNAEGGQCDITLIQDEGQSLSESAVVGSPQYFEIVSKAGQAVFRFYGILKTIKRDVDPSSKTYTATLQSPTVLLKACEVVTENFAGHGGAIEAYGPNIPACLDFGHNNASITPATVYNIQNVFGVYENDSYGAAGAGFGKSVVNDQGMRLDFFSYALDQLVNGNTTYTPYLGGNIVYGSNSYTLTGNNAFAYNFDILGFMNQVASFLPSDYRVRATNLMDFVQEVCNEANHVFFIDLLKPSNAGNSAFASGHISTTVPNQVYANTTYGGQIVVITQNRNTVQSNRFPLSQGIIVGEVSDKVPGSGQTRDLPLDIGLSGIYHPDGTPVASYPYGGSFPAEQILLNERQRYQNTSLEVTLSEDAIGGKYVVGGYRSRMNFISTYPGGDKTQELAGSTCITTSPGDSDPQPDVYCYWGEINLAARLNLSAYSTVRNIPVVTPFLNGIYEYTDFILIDIYDIVGDLTIGSNGVHNGALFNGIYACSLAELRYAMTSYEAWADFMLKRKSSKVYAFESYFTDVLYTNKRPLYYPNGRMTYEGYALAAAGLNAISKYNTRASNTDSSLSCSIGGPNAALASVNELFTKLHEKIRTIGEEHYGKSYAVKCPAFAVALDANNEATADEYIKSWDLADDAFIDPSNYDYYEAPSGPFVNGGRIKGYANFLCEINQAALPYGPYNQTFYKALKYTANYDFKDFNKDDVVSHQILTKKINSIPISIDQKYLFIPSSYFTAYSLTSLPAPGTAFEASQLTIPAQIVSIVNALKTMIIPENGIGCVPYALVKTSRVYVPTLQDKYTSPEAHIQYLIRQCDGASNSSKSIDSRQQEKDISPYPLAAVPYCFGIPQQSNRYVYGPWVTQTALPYGAKFQYEQVTDLVPENYIMPASVNINGISATITSGYDGMNAVGQLMANSVEDFDFLFTEQGSVTIAGYPQITNLGQSLIENGPLVSDISVDITAQSISTTYGMRTYSPRFGRTNKYIIDKISRLGRIVKG